jgi:hypothetical protein
MIERFWALFLNLAETSAREVLGKTLTGFSVNKIVMAVIICVGRVYWVKGG